MNKSILFLILVLSLVLNFLGLNWGLPCQERNKLYFDNEDEIKQSVIDVSPEKVVRSMTTERKELAGSRFNPIHSYHPDESNFIKAVSNMNPGKLDFNPRYLYYGTLYIYLFVIALAIGFLSGFIKPTADILFYFLNPDKIANFYLTGRFISAIFGVLTVYLVYRISRELYDERVGLVSALLLCVTPALVINSHYISTDVTMTFFVCLAFFMTVKILRSSDLKWYVLAGICSGFAAQAKYNAGPILLAVPVADLLREWKGKKDLILCWFRKKVLLSYICAAGAFFFLLLPVMFSNPMDFVRCLSGGVLRTGPKLSIVGSNFLFYLRVFYHGLGFPLFIMAIAGTVIAFLKKSKEDVLLLSWLIFNWILLLLLSPIVDRHMRYILIILPFFIIITARIVIAIQEKIGKGFAILLILLIFLPSLFFSYGYDKLFISENIRTTAGKWIAQNIPAGSSVGLRRDPWQYETPPVNQRKYRLFIAGRNPEETAKSLDRQKPNYFIISNAEYLDNFQVWNELLCERGYELCKEFSNPPRVFGIPINHKNPSDDYIYLYPKILIYGRG